MRGETQRLTLWRATEFHLTTAFRPWPSMCSMCTAQAAPCSRRLTSAASRHAHACCSQCSQIRQACMHHMPPALATACPVTSSASCARQSIPSHPTPTPALTSLPCTWPHTRRYLQAVAKLLGGELPSAELQEAAALAWDVLAGMPPPEKERGRAQVLRLQPHK